jgi:hypothetical protein
MQLFPFQVSLHHILAIKRDTLAGLSRCRLVKCNIRIQLRLFFSDLVRDIVSLCLLDLQLKHFKLQLQDLVLNFAILEDIRSIPARSIDCGVEGIRFSSLSSLSSIRDNLNVIGINLREIRLIDLQRIDH